MKRPQALLALVLACASPPAAGAAEPLLVGLAAADATPPIGVPLAGHGTPERRGIDWLDRHPYAAWMRPSVGTRDPIRAKALVLRRGDEQLLWLSLDTVAVTARILDDVVARAARHGFTRETVLLSATHTHNGPGTLSRSWFWNLVTMDRFRPEILEGFVEKVGEAVDAAVASLAPARLLTARFEVSGVQANRRLRPGDFDPRANLLVARGEDGVWRGGIVHLALHGTSLPTDDLAFSADVPGRIEAALEARFAAANPPGAPAATVLFVNGAEGDVIPSAPGAEAMQALADRVGDQAAYAMTRLRPVEPVWRLRHADLALGRPHVNVAGCLSPEQRPTWASRLLGWLPLALPKLPQETRLSALRLGDLVMLSWPGEPTTALGRALDALHPGAWTLGLTNDHLSYFTAPAEYAEGGYEACATLYGKGAGLRIVERHRELLEGDPRAAGYAP